MKERPIIFSGPMVRAILENRKGQTRRVMKEQPQCSTSSFWLPHKKFIPSFDEDGWVHCSICGGGMKITRNGATGIACPYGKPGDRLWVKEAFFAWREKTYSTSGVMKEGPYRCAYRADDGILLNGAQWKSPYFMRRRFSRITLEITDVRIQRVQEISEEDAIAEGMPSDHPIDGYRSLWNLVNRRRGFGWEVNPWVWVLTFQRIAT